ncbi:antibiotic biosynthesis monooxygenase [Rhodospirillales bacterium]|nr:antibiotic biosynthesis monooxygenase [Rhodospirillales bacterium]
MWILKKSKKVMDMSNFASSVRFQVKIGQENAFLEAVKKFDVSQHLGCISHQVIDAGNGRFQSNVVWESEDAIAVARPNLIKFLDTLRPTLAEISPELGVTDPISGPIIKK